MELEVLATPGMSNKNDNSVSQLFRLNNLNKYKKRKEQEEKEDFGNIPQSEIILVESILDRFVIPQDTSNVELVNIQLALKCLPRKVTLKVSLAKLSHQL